MGGRRLRRAGGHHPPAGARGAGCRTLLTCAWSLQRSHRDGSRTGSVALAALLGQIGLPGGGFAFGHGSMNGAGNPRPDLPAGNARAATAGASIPSRAWPTCCCIPASPMNSMAAAASIQTSGWCTGRQATLPSPSGPEPAGAGLDAARTIIVHEPWWTPTARAPTSCCRPPPRWAQRRVGGSCATVTSGEGAGASRPQPQRLRHLSRAGGDGGASSRSIPKAVTRWPGSAISTERCGRPGRRSSTLPDFDAFWERGHVALPEPPRDFVLFEQFRADPRLDRLGQAGAAQRGAGRLRLRRLPAASGLAAAGGMAGRRGRPWPLHLVTPARPAAFAAGPVERRARGRDRRREPVRMHPADAAASARGRVRLSTNAARLPGRRRPGRGRGARRGGHGHGRLVRPARRGARRHGNPNVLTRDEGTSRLAQGCSALSALVQAEKWAGGPEPVRVFEPPALARLAAEPGAPARPGGRRGRSARKPRPANSPRRPAIIPSRTRPLVPGAHYDDQIRICHRRSGVFLGKGIGPQAASRLDAAKCYAWRLGKPKLAAPPGYNPFAARL